MLVTVIIPAHNEGEIIGATLRALLADKSEVTLDVIVVCNGCTDDTAAQARVIGCPVRVIESDIPSKTEAINRGLEAASGDIVVVQDADIELTARDVHALAVALLAPGLLAAAPTPRMRYLPSTAWLVRAYFRAWFALPYVREGMMGAGVYALNAQGRARLGRFPRVIADDGYARMLFEPHERVEVTGSTAVVLAPLTLRELVKIRTRSRLGWYELADKFPHLVRREVGTKDYRGAMLSLLRPARWIDACVYVAVNLWTRVRAARQARALHRYAWERDDGSRRVAARAAQPADQGSIG